MKKYLVIISLACAASMYASEKTIINYAKGPVKQITINKNLNDGRVQKQMYWYDSISRLVEEAHYLDDALQYGYVYQYHSDVFCMQYLYNSSGLVDGWYTQIRLDSAGNRIACRTYTSGNFFHADSTVYDAHGNKLKIYYINQDKPEAPILMTTYEYDSLGRLYKYGGEGMECWIEYLPNGNYIEHHATSVYIDPSSEKTNVMKEEETFILNQEGEIAEIKGPAQHLVYSNFDRHGNWRKLKCTNKTSGTTTTTRVIEYYE